MAMLKPFDEADLYAAEPVEPDLGWAGLLLVLLSGVAVGYAFSVVVYLLS